MDEEYGVIVLGTVLKECILNCLLSVDGLKCMILFEDEQIGYSIDLRLRELLHKLQVLSFMFVPNCRWCPLRLNLTSFVSNITKSCTLGPLALTQSKFLVKYGHVTCT
ncbi:putative GDP dissociation inhibitor, FAD/NAD(P)-binding domain superfamily [Helianthus anomalus]